MSDWVTLISNVGFPIAMCLIVYLDTRKMLERILLLLEKMADD